MMYNSFFMNWIGFVHIYKECFVALLQCVNCALDEVV